MTTTTQKTLTKITNLDQLDELHKSSAYTITGAGGDLNDWIEGYNGLLQEAGIGTPAKWFTWTGEQMNTHYSLTDSQAYPKDLTFLAFTLDGLDLGKLAMFKMMRGDRWLDDIVYTKHIQSEV